MKRKVIWLLVSTFVAIPVALASSGEKADMVKVKATKLDGTVVEKMVEKPRYGGTFTGVYTADPTIFDECFAHKATGQTLSLTNEELMQGDWARGAAGTGETDWVHLFCPAPPPSTATGCLAERFEMPDPNTLVFHIRKGIHWHDKPPMNGREFVAEDAVFSLKRHWEVPNSYHYGVYPWKTHIESIAASDKWTVVIKCLPGKAGFVYEMAADHLMIQPREVIEKYGDMKDWKNSCGTGPFMLVDYVTGSSATFRKNPNYWMKDPLHPENRLPYVDEVKFFIIPDISTRLAALRTGKVDWLGGYSSGVGAVGWEDADSLMKTNPELKYKKYLNSSSAPVIFMRVDKPDLPFKDVRVRRALAMAINNQEMVDTVYGGNADILAYPAGDLPELKDVYIPLDKLPESVRELYEYHPEKAKQLLAEAGYPNGFKTQLITTSAGADLFSVIKSYWSAVGVDLELDIKEFSISVSIGAKKSHKEMFAGTYSPAIPFKFTRSQANGYWNYSMINDPVIQEAFQAVSAAYLDWNEKCRILRELIPYELDRCYFIPLPAEYQYTFWEPWIKGYDGETMVGYMNNYDFPKYLWVDQKIKDKG